MRLYLVIDETRFYHPDFIADLLRKTKDEVVGAALVTKILPKNSLEEYLKKNVTLLKPTEIFKLVCQRYVSAAKEKFSKPKKDGPFYSVRGVFEAFGVDYIEVEYNINQPQYLNHIRQAQPDVIISSNSLIFGKELLSLPKKCIINRHSGLLPAYGGLWPVFQAYRNGEKYTGVSVHTMEKKIDRGIVLAQKPIEISAGLTLADLYKKCFAVSADVILEALEKVRKDDLSPCTSQTNHSYFSFPTKEHWTAFRSRGGRFI